MRKIIQLTYTILFLIVSLNTVAQKTVVAATVDKNSIYIGEQIKLTLETDLSESSFKEIDSIPHFEIVEKSKIDSQLSNNKILLKQTYTLTSFDSGKWLLSLEGVQIKSKPISITVTFSPFDPKQEYHDIKDIINVQKPKRTTWYWYLIGAILLLLLFILFFPKNKKEKKVLPVEDKDAYKKAIAQIEKLRKEKAYEGEPKIFYTQLTDVFRRYLSQRKGIQSATKTTDDLAIQIRSLGLNESIYTGLLQTLRLSDAVKFAKFNPGVVVNETALNTIKNSIQQIEEKRK